jgi:integrase
MRRPVLYQEPTKSGMVWYARFFDKEGKYLCARSLGIPVEGKRERRREAEEAAELIAGELKIKNEPPDGKLFISYLEAFWSPGSDYIEEQAQVNKTPLSSMYIENNLRQIRLHILPCPLFTGLLLVDLSRKIIRDYKLWGAKEGMSGRLINQCLQTMRIAVRYAVANGELPADPFYGAGKAYHKEKIKGILTALERDQLIMSKTADYYSRLSVLLALLCSMRLGEIRGLRWGDVGDGIITIRHNFVDGDGAKNPKRKGGLVQENTRKVPMPNVIADLLNSIKYVKRIAAFTGPDDFIIQSIKRKGVPVSSKYFPHALKRELSGIGITIEEQKRRNLTMHSLRHGFVTLGRLSGITDLEIQALAGHGARMMEHYSHADQVIDMKQVGAKLEKSLLPAPVNKILRRKNTSKSHRRKGKR